MTSPVIERVAKAIYAASGGDPEKVDAWKRPLWKSREKEARAAIAAMREPTATMIEAGYAEIGDAWPDPRDIAKPFSAMIDAALKEP